MLARSFIVLSILCVPAAVPGRAQPTLLDNGYRQMYNLQFAEAHRSFEEWERSHPDDPLGPVSQAAAFLFSEFDRMHILQSEFFTHDQHFITDHKLTPDPALKARFDEALAKARSLASRAPDDARAIFASVLAHGLHGDYLALIEKRYGDSFKELKAARMQADRLLTIEPGFYDAWLAAGVENYMLSTKPAPVRWFLRAAGGETDRATGVARLRLVAEKGHFLAPFARLLLAVAALRENDLERGRGLLAGLAREFPRNPLYRRELALLGTPVEGGTD